MSHYQTFHQHMVRFTGRAANVLAKLLLVCGILILFSLVRCIGGHMIAQTEDETCRDYVVAEYPAPDKAKKLIVYGHKCAGQAWMGTHAALVSRGQKLGDNEGSIFVADMQNYAPAVTRVAWKNNRALTLTYRAGAELLLAKDTLDGVTFEYRAIKP